MTSKKQASYTCESVIDAYRRIGNVRGVCSETGCPPYVAFIWLRKAGVLSTGDKARYGTNNQKRGGAAEEEFIRLVPKAMPSNEAIHKNCPSFDFDLGGVLVDVKSSMLRNNGKWGWSMGAGKPLRPDFYVVFLAVAPSGDIAKGYRLLLIPDEMFPDAKDAVLSPTNPLSIWWKFEVKPEELNTVLEMAK